MTIGEVIAILTPVSAGLVALLNYLNHRKTRRLVKPPVTRVPVNPPTPRQPL